MRLSSFLRKLDLKPGDKFTHENSLVSSLAQLKNPVPPTSGKLCIYGNLGEKRPFKVKFALLFNKEDLSKSELRILIPARHKKNKGKKKKK